ncbi:UNVERIFIED_CONTAM: hypothetical protein Sradi_5409200 [Sesamum radiatum]|uniref:Aminotransferase-like plant mobile domain-containing protein n=1 Tax=Sesamum radiatum TaxID=300843 RepID=A0AAW2LAF1_SESRA
MEYLGFQPDAGAFKGSQLQVQAIESHIARVQITPDIPYQIVIQYACVVALLLLGGMLCPNSSGNLISLLYLAKLEDIVEARNYSWDLGRTRIIPLCPELGTECVHMGQFQIDNNHLLTAAPYGAIWNCEHNFTQIVRTTIRVIRDILDEMQSDQLYDMDSDVIIAYAGDFNPQLWRSIYHLIFYAIVEMHHPERIVRQFGMRQNIPKQLDTRDISLHKITRSNRTSTDWVLQHIHYITRWQRRYDAII